MIRIERHTRKKAGSECTHLNDDVGRPSQDEVEKEVGKGDNEEHQYPEVSTVNRITAVHLKDLECLRENDSLRWESATCEGLEKNTRELSGDADLQEYTRKRQSRTIPTAFAAPLSKATDTE